MIQRWRQGLLRISLLLCVFQDPSGIHPTFFGAVPDMGLEPCIFCRIRRMCLGQLETSPELLRPRGLAGNQRSFC